MSKSYWKVTTVNEGYGYVSDTFIQSQLPKGIAYVGADASHCCLIKHPHLLM